MAATLVCGSSLFTACVTDYGDNPVTPKVRIAIDKENFPDDIFREYLLGQNYGKDGVLTEREIMNITEIDVYDMEISSLQGIEYFTALTVLDCDDNELTTLDVSNNPNLEDLECEDNQISSLDFTNNPLLSFVSLTRNKISGQNMDNLISSLLQSTETPEPIIDLIDYSEGDEENVCTKTQVAAIKAKGWKPRYYNEEEDEWTEYEGSDE